MAGILDPTRLVLVIRAGFADFDQKPVIRGVLDPRSLSLLKVDKAYQREAMSEKARKDINDALRQGQRLPDLELAQRGSDDYDTDNDGPGDVFGLAGPVFVVDGHQRLTSILAYMKKINRMSVYQGCIVTLNTTFDWERERFNALGLNRRKISASLHLRNLRNEVPLIAALHGMTTNGDKNPMVLNQRVCWDQAMGKDHLINALQLCDISLCLHRFLTPLGKTNTKDTADLLQRLDRQMRLQIFRDNVATFWNALENAWKFSAVKTHLGRQFLNIEILRIVALVISEHDNFWPSPQSEYKLRISADWVQRLRQIDVRELQRAYSGAGINRSVIKAAIIEEMNKGKSSQRLHKRDERGWAAAAE